MRTLALEAGFDAAGIAGCDLSRHGPDLRRWLAAGHAAGMRWLARDEEVRLDPRRRFPWARSVVVVLRGYRPRGPEGEDPRPGLSRFVSRYAWGADYHEVLLPRLGGLADRMRAALGRPDMRAHAYVDTGPVLERQLAEAAGLGWRGNNTLLLNERTGSAFFLGVLITDLDLSPGRPTTVSCGSCRACQPACPTGAFVRPGVLDSGRCISYLTIEHRGPIDRALRPAMGQWLFGCDLCQSACPFEHNRAMASDPAFRLGTAVAGISLAALLDLDEVGFRARFRRTPLWRPRREGLLRNALVVAANGEHRECVPAARRLLRDASPVLREAAGWCLARLRARECVDDLRTAASTETEAWVREALCADLRDLEAAHDE